MSLHQQLILCTCPDMTTAETIAGMLIADKSAACVNILPGLTSIYLWQNRIEKTQECLLLIKTSQHLYHKVETSILANHPYELPEVIAVPIEHGLPGYLQWIDSCLS